MIFGNAFPGKIFLNFTLTFFKSDVDFYMVTAVGYQLSIYLIYERTHVQIFWIKSKGSDIEFKVQVVP